MHEIPKEMPYARQWIAELKQKGFGVYYLSNYSVFLREACPEALEFTKTADGGVFSCDVQLIKPDRAIYAALCEKYHLNPAECLFVDDNPKNIAAAKAFGMQTVLFESYEKQYPEIMKLLANSTK